MLTLLRRSMFSDLSEASSCHSATQCLRQHMPKACVQNNVNVRHREHKVIKILPDLKLNAPN